jgi:CubicO group peptidase (beta-lactamase class C family)
MWPRVVAAIALVAGFALSVASLDAQPAAPIEPAAPASLDEFRREAVKILDEAGVPGAGIALVRSHGIEWAGGIGLADRDAGVPVTADTHFRVGSISKTFVAIALVLQYEDGEMELDATVRDLAPNIRIENPWEASDPVTVRHLLQHTAGFDDMHFNEMYNVRHPADWSLADVLARNPASRRVRWRPGTRMSYSNPGYAVAGYVLEQVTKKPYETVIEERIFKPLAMTTSRFTLTEADYPLLAKGYDERGGPPVPYSQIYLRPAGNLHSSPAELAAFVRMLLNWGEIEGGDLVVDPEYLSNMERPETTLAAKAGLLYGYGSGIASQSVAGYIVLGHGGGIEGFSSIYGYSVSRDAGYVILLNATYAPQALRQLSALAVRYLKRDVEPPRKPEANLAPGVLDAYAGYYHVDGGRNQVFAGIEWLQAGVTVHPAGNTLTIAPLFGSSSVLVPVSPNLFRRPEDVVPSRVFTKDDQGRDALMGDGFLAVRTDRWRVEVVRVPVLLSLALIATVPLVFLIWLVHSRAARPRGFWLLKIALIAIPLSLVALASLNLWAPARDWGVLNPWTFLTFAGSCTLPISALAAVGLTIGAWARGAGRWLRAYALVVAVAGLIVSSFLASAGLIAIQPWAF